MKKVRYIALALVLILALVGGAYAWWTDTIEIDGTVATGELDVIFSSALGDDGEYEEVVAVEIVEEDKKVEFTVNNLYPRLANDGEDYASVTITVKNNSTIPVKVTDITVSSEDPWVQDYLRFRRGDSWDLDLDGLEGHLESPLLGAELDVDEEHEIETWIYLSSGAENETQDQTGSFTVEFEFGQYNYEE